MTVIYNLKVSLMSSKARVETANIVKQITVRKQVIVRLFCSDINIDITFGQLFFPRLPHFTPKRHSRPKWDQPRFITAPIRSTLAQSTIRIRASVTIQSKTFARHLVENRPV